MEFVKLYGFKENLRYWLWYKWKFKVLGIYWILKGDHKLNDMHWKQYLDSMDGFADAQAGRFLRLKEDAR